MLTSPTRALRLTAGARNWRQIVASCERKLQIVPEMNDVVLRLKSKVSALQIKHQIIRILDKDDTSGKRALDSSNE